MKTIEEQIAKVCHEANRALCEGYGDFTQVPWKMLKNPEKLIVIAGVIQLLKVPETTCAESHAQWCLNKRAEGWTYGTVKNEIAKTHPSLVAFEDLPGKQKLKDELFRAIVLSLSGENLIQKE